MSRNESKHLLLVGMYGMTELGDGIIYNRASVVLACRAIG